jgi:hypothetical protein
MSMAVHGYTYLGSSTLAGRDLRLQTSGGRAAGTCGGVLAHPRFFAGFLTTPVAAAVGLLGVAEVARTRYFQPVSPASLDPVVTGSRDRLRFESFSGCCGVYARLDVLPSGLDGDIIDHGTTNVDVNPPLRQALARVGGIDPLHLAVGPDDVTVSTMDSSVVEKKVPLPDRWLRGFAEVQVIAARFDQRAEIPATEATAFLRRLSTGNDKSVLWAVPAGRTLRLTSRPVPGAVCLSGAGRLVALRPFLRFARALRVYGPPVTAANAAVASTWELDTGALRLSLTLSPEPYRGFSGEGAVLSGLASTELDDADADLVGALLAWEPTVDVDDLADRAGIGRDRASTALARLGTAGQVGYDVAEAAYFHRILPYDAARVQRHNPRLADARALVDAGGVAVEGPVATVRSGAEVYRVRQVDGHSRCTCPWWGKYQGERGPCKHALAVDIATRVAREAAHQVQS